MRIESIEMVANEIALLRDEVVKFQGCVSLIKEAIENSKNVPREHSERLAELEVKMLKLWGLLTEETPQGKTKLSKEGKTYREWFEAKKN